MHKEREVDKFVGNCRIVFRIRNSHSAVGELRAISGNYEVLCARVGRRTNLIKNRMFFVSENKK